MLIEGFGSRPDLEPVELHRGQILYESGDVIDYAYFPLNSMISLVAELSDGSSVEIGITGYEGITYPGEPFQLKNLLARLIDKLPA